MNAFTSIFATALRRAPLRPGTHLARRADAGRASCRPHQRFGGPHGCSTAQPFRPGPGKAAGKDLVLERDARPRRNGRWEKMGPSAVLAPTRRCAARLRFLAPAIDPERLCHGEGHALHAHLLAPLGQAAADPRELRHDPRPLATTGLSDLVPVGPQWKQRHFYFAATAAEQKARISFSNFEPGTYELAGVSLRPGGLLGLEDRQRIEDDSVPVMRHHHQSSNNGRPCFWPPKGTKRANRIFGGASSTRPKLQL